ncbi:hypothetical protein Dda_3714 [Drechslerella dactyloides]|uniref:Uncharacterized protein n=1 Tax=Drechslerella dactyloides TaxID=74499 RepID=A0AAD6IZZ6_DREDA|nr:hypothetical protein Dda_3714 [Drechslerella dactyloides]
MGSSKLHSPIRGIVVLATILSAAQFSTAAPTIEVGTSVISAPDPIPNIIPGKDHTYLEHEAIVQAEFAKDEIKKRDANVLTTWAQNKVPENAIGAGNTAATGTHSETLSKRQFNTDFTRARSNSAPARIGSFGPDITDEQNAIAGAVDNLQAVAEQALQNAANEQQQGFNNPNFGFGQPPTVVQGQLASFAPAIQTAWSPPAASLQPVVGQTAQQPAAVIEPAGFQVLDGLLSGPLQDNAQQPENVIAGLGPANNPADEVVVLDGTLQGPLQGGAQQPAAVVDVTPDTPYPGSDFQVLDGTLSGPLEGGAQQPQDILSSLPPPADFSVLDGTLQNLLEGDAQQPQGVLPGLDNTPFAPTPADFTVLDGTLKGPLEGDAQQPLNILPALDETGLPGLDVYDGIGQPLQNGALQPASTVPMDVEDQAINQLSQTQPGQVIQNADDTALPAIVSAPDLWQQVFDSPDVQQFLQGNNPASLQPFLQPETRQAIEQDPNSAGTFVPGLTNATPDQISNFANFIDTLPPNQQVSLVTDGPAIADLTQAYPAELSDVLDQASGLKTPQIFGPFLNDNIASAMPESTVFGGGGEFTPNGFEQSPVGPNGLPPFAFPDTQAFPDNGQFIPNGFAQSPTGSDAFAPFTPDAQSVNNYSPESGVPTNLLLQNGGVLHFNCVPVYTDANGVKYPAAEIQAQALNSLNLASFGAMSGPPPSDPNLLNDVVSQDDGSIVSASQIDGNTVLINTDQQNDSEQVVKQLQDGWTMQAEDTDGVRGFDRQIVSNGGVNFVIDNPNGIPTDSILGADTVGKALDASLGSDARISVESTQ